MTNQTQPEKLVAYIRDGLAEQEHFGFIIRLDKQDRPEKIGEDRNYPFFLRSCAKPLQASLLIDYELDKRYDMSEAEIAVCCASHTGEKVHTDLVKGLLNKFEIPVSALKCGICEPLSQIAKNELILHNQTPNPLHNNCSGKHAMMLGLCKLKGWDTKNYDDINHPLQQEIKRKIHELCELKSSYPITKDGCGVPIFSMPLSNIVKGYLNLFCNEHYIKIKNAFINHPYIIGGENRTDTKIISQCKNLIAKVGAGGLCVVINTELQQGFIVKICDSNMQAREIVTADLIKNLHWGEVEVCTEIKTLHNEIVGNIKTLI